MRTELADYSGREIKVIGTYICANNSNIKGKVLIKDLINADTGEYLADHVWLDYTKEMNRSNILSNETIFFIGKVSRYQKGYRGHLPKKILNTKAPSYDYEITSPHNIVKKNECTYNKNLLKKLNYRKNFLLEKKDENKRKKQETSVLIDEIENEKKLYKNNSILSVRPIRTIEPVFKNKFYKFPLIYSLIEAFKQKDIPLNEKFNYFKEVYDDIKFYRFEKNNIKVLNSKNVREYRKMRTINNRLKNIDELLTVLDDAITPLENYNERVKNIDWEIKPEENVKQKRAVLRR